MVKERNCGHEISLKREITFLSLKTIREISLVLLILVKGKVILSYSGDLTSIYLLEEYQGLGIGKQLLKQLFLQIKELGLDRVIVEVLEDNNTRYFYQYYGANLLKKEQITIAGSSLNHIIFEWNDVNQVLLKL